MCTPNHLVTWLKPGRAWRTAERNSVLSTLGLQGAGPSTRKGGCTFCLCDTMGFYLPETTNYCHERMYLVQMIGVPSSTRLLVLDATAYDLSTTCATYSRTVRTSGGARAIPLIYA